ncbi:MAG TPA: RNA polymerase sigma factor [Rhodanobacteraceae bacterium]
MSLREDALYASYCRLERALFNVLYRQLWQHEDCQDVIHDAYLRIWARRERITPDTLDALVWTTALNLARNRLRWRRLWRHEPLDVDLHEAPTGRDDDFLATRRLHDALQHLPAAERDVLLLSEFSGLRGAEIASVLGIPVGTVASRKHHAMTHLKAFLGDTAHA